MPQVRFSHDFDAWPIERQTPGSSGRWGDCEFVPSDTPGADAPDYWLVYEALTEPEHARVAPSRVIFVTGEPEAKRRYHPRFLAQFGLVVTSQRRIRGDNVVHTQPLLPWHVGVRRREGEGGDAAVDVATLGYDELRSSRPAKRRDLSVVCSTKGHVEGQRARLAFVERLQRHFGDRLDWFGRGVRPVADKWDAVAPYRFHLALENTAEPDYWSEKLADSYLGLAFPLYWGCPNLDDYFDRGAYEPLDLSRPDEAIARIERLLEEGIPPERELELVRARERVLDEYNLFPAVARLLERCGDERPRTVRLRPAATFERPPAWRRAVARAARAATSRIPQASPLL